MSEIIQLGSLESVVEGEGTTLSISSIPTMRQLDIVNLSGKDLKVLSIDGKSVTLYKASDYTIHVKSSQSLSLIDPATCVAGLIQNSANISYKYKGVTCPFTQLPDADYYIVPPELFKKVTRGQLCTVDRPVEEDGELVYTSLLFNTCYKPAILEITDKGLLEVRLCDNITHVVGSFKYNKLSKTHIASKLKRLHTVFLRQHMYIKMVVCDPEVAHALDLDPDLKADLSRMMGDAKVKRKDK